LAPDACKRTAGKLVAECTRHGHLPRLGRMLELAVASTLSNLTPPVSFELPKLGSLLRRARSAIGCQPRLRPAAQGVS